MFWTPRRFTRPSSGEIMLDKKKPEEQAGCLPGRLFCFSRFELRSLQARPEAASLLRKEQTKKQAKQECKRILTHLVPRDKSGAEIRTPPTQRSSYPRAGSDARRFPAFFIGGPEREIQLRVRKKSCISVGNRPSSSLEYAYYWLIVRPQPWDCFNFPGHRRFSAKEEA